MAWTDKMVEELKKLWDMGITTGEIGKRLGISKNSIVGKVHRLGLEGRPSPIKKSNESSDKENKSAKKSAPKKETVTKNTKSSDKKTKSTPKTIKKETVEISAPEKEIEKPVKTKSAPVENKPLIDEDDIKLIKSLDVKPNKDYKKENISLTELDNHTCRWPLGDPKDTDFHFCGRKVKTGQTYCEEHSAIAYVKPTRR